MSVAVTLPVPPSVPADTVSVGVVASAFRFAVPPLTVMKFGASVPLAGVSVNVPPLAVIELGFMAVVGVKFPTLPPPLSEIDPVSVYAPLMFSVPAVTDTLPAPLIGPLAVYVPPPNCSVAPDATVNPVLSVPPPFRLNVPLLTFTVPVLLNAPATCIVPTPAIVKLPLPALFTVPNAPTP